MNEFVSEAAYFGIVLSLLAYWIGAALRKRFPYTIVNPLLIATLIVIAVLSLLNIEYDSYNQGAKYLTWLLTPATVCLAVPMYRQISVLLANKAAVFIGILSGVLACILIIAGFGAAFRLENGLIASMLPKSITTAIAIGVSEEIGGNATITIAAVLVTGLFGSMTAKLLCRIFKITEPVAVGLACGNAAHAIGTSKALELGEIEGAMSSLAIIVAGVMTVILAPFVMLLLD